MTTTPEFIASYWTLAGNVVPLGPPEQEASPHDFRERVEVAARLGYCGVGVTCCRFGVITIGAPCEPYWPSMA